MTTPLRKKHHKCSSICLRTLSRRDLKQFRDHHPLFPYRSRCLFPRANPLDSFSSGVVWIFGVLGMPPRQPVYWSCRDRRCSQIINDSWKKLCAMNWRLESFSIVFVICSKRSIISLNVFSPPQASISSNFREKSHLIQKDVESVFASPAPKSEPRIYEGVLSAKGVDSCYRKNVPVQLVFLPFLSLKAHG